MKWNSMSDIPTKNDEYLVKFTDGIIFFYEVVRWNGDKWQTDGNAFKYPICWSEFEKTNKDLPF